ncbi:MAG: c-type cytochrome [Akkermansiaceae bacterium]|nr:c-type cytochrome [Akkermansiaceae bacterium]
MSDQLQKETGDPNVVLRPHVFDGIQEYDQKLPNWWLFTLYIMIVWFAIWWVFYYQFGAFKTDHEQIDSEIAVVEQKRNAQLEELVASLNDKALWEMSQKPDVIAAGQQIFAGKCVACHAADLSAIMTDPAGNKIKLPGEPLNDNTWKYGGNPMAVFNTVTNGSPDITKGMIAWKLQMGPADIVKVVAYVMSHHKEGEEIILAPPAPPAGAPAPAATSAPGAAPAPAPAAPAPTPPPAAK